MAIKKIFTKIILVFFVLSFLLPLSLVTAALPALATGPYECFSDNGGLGKAVNANVLRIESCSEAYVFDPQRTIQNHTPTFVSSNNNDVGPDHPKGSYQIRLVNCGGSAGIAGYDPNGSPIANAQGENCRKLEDTDNFKNAASGAPADLCSMIKNTSCKIWDGTTSLGTGGNQEVVDGKDYGNFDILPPKGGDLAGPICNANNCNDFIANVNNLPKGTAAGQNCGSQGGALSFLFCPILESISSAITWLLGGSAGTQATDTNGGLLVDLLKIPPLDPNTDGGKVVQGVVNNMVQFANVFYILLFVIIIFATVIPIGVDNYTIKKTLPKLIVAIILTQFSFLICSIAVDIGNLLGFGVPNLLFQAIAGVPNFANQSSQVGGIPTALIAAIPMASGFAGFLPLFATVGIIVVVVLFIVVFIGILTAFFWLMARYLIVYFLIFLTPLAFAAMVLPGTQKYFKMWAEDSVKVLLTFPIVTGMLAGSLVISQVLTNVLNAQAKPGEVGFGIKEIMVGLIPVIALLAIPKTLKWSGKLSSAVGGAIGGYIGAKAGSAKNTVSGAAKGYGKKAAGEGVQDFRNRQAASIYGRSTNPNRSRGQQSRDRLIASILAGNTPTRRGQQRTSEIQGRMIDEEQKNAANALAGLGRDALATQSAQRLAAFGSSPGQRANARAIGEARAHVAKLVDTGDSQGLARAYQTFVTSARASGMNDQEISDYWNSTVLDTKYGDAKALSPTLVGGSPATMAEIGVASGRALTGTESAVPNGVPAPTAGGNLVQRTGVDASAYGGFNGGENYTHMTNGNFSGLGEDKLLGMDADQLKSIITSIHAGEDQGRFQFNQQAVESVLNDPTARFKSAEARRALREIAIRKGWNFGP